MGLQINTNIGLGNNSLLLDSVKPLPGVMLTYHLSGPHLDATLE